MRKISVPLFILCLSLICSSCGKKTDELPIAVVNVDMEKMRWKLSDFPIQLNISDNLDVESRNQISDVMDEWEQTANINFFEPNEVTPNLNFTKLSDYYHRNKNVNGIYLAINEIDELGSNVVAVTQIYFETLRDSDSTTYYHIVEADIVLNGFHYTFSTDSLDLESFYLYYVVLHEIGHVLGLGHQQDGIMNPYVSTRDKTETLTSTEADVINAKYNIKSTLNADSITSIEKTATDANLQRIMITLTEEKLLAYNFINMKLTPGNVIKKAIRLSN